MEFREVFNRVEKALRPRLQQIGFVLHRINVDETACFGSARYGEQIWKFQRIERKRYIEFCTAPLRLELDLDFGIADERYSLTELFELQGKGSFPPRRHDLYTAVHEALLLQEEFERLLDQLLACGQRFIDGDASLWDDLQAQRSSRIADAALEDLYRQATIAFRRGEWAKLAALLAARESDLNELNLARLVYARARLR